MPSDNVAYGRVISAPRFECNLTAVTSAAGAPYSYRTIFELSPGYTDPVTPVLFAFFAVVHGCILVTARPDEAG